MLGQEWGFLILLRVCKNSSHNDISEDETFGGRKDFSTLFFYCLIYLILYTLWMARAGNPNILYEGKKF